MRSFPYLRDPLCLAACGLYALNVAWLRPHFGGAFLRGQFNDTLLIPAALPLVLWVQRRLGVRPDDRRPTWSEIGLHLVVWSVAAEAIVPHLLARATGDWRDVAAYAAGAAVAGTWWNGTG